MSFNLLEFYGAENVMEAYRTVFQQPGNGVNRVELVLAEAVLKYVRENPVPFAEELAAVVHHPSRIEKWLAADLRRDPAQYMMSCSPADECYDE